MTKPDKQQADDRAAFEEWFEANIMPLEHSNWFERDADGFYRIDGVDSAWDGWQAALTWVRRDDNTNR